MTRPLTAGARPYSAATVVAERVLVAATTLFLFVAPFAGSAGLRATCLIVAALALAVTHRAAVPKPFRALPRSMLAAFAAWALVALLSFTWSVRPELTLAELRAELLYGVLAFGVFFLASSDPSRWRVWWIALVAGTLTAIVTKVLQPVLGLDLWRHAPREVAGAFSTHLVLVAALLPALVCPPPWGFRRNAIALALALVALFAAAWDTGNRIVWPALFAGFLVAIFAGRKTAAFELREMHALRRVIIAGGIAMTLAFAASIAEKSDRFYPKYPTFTSSLERDIRPQLWAVGWREFLDAPWLGHGYGREILAPSFLPLTPVGVDHPPLTHAHNIFLNVALQLGVVGLAVFLVLLALLAREYAGFLTHPAVAPLGVMGFALLSGFIVKNQTDDFLHRHNALVFWAVTGMLIGLGRGTARR